MTLNLGLYILRSKSLLLALIVSLIVTITLYIIILTARVVIVIQTKLFYISYHLHLLFIYIRNHAVLEVKITHFHLLWLQECASLQFDQVDWFVLLDAALLLVDVDEELF